MGVQNAEILNNLTVDIVEHSYMKDRIEMSEEAFRCLKTAKAENYEHIYLADQQGDVYEDTIRPMFAEMYDVLLQDLLSERLESPLFKHHIERIERQRSFYNQDRPYREEDPDDIVTDYLAAMTDEYFLQAHKFLCPDSEHHVTFRGYFDNL